MDSHSGLTLLPRPGDPRECYALVELYSDNFYLSSGAYVDNSAKDPVDKSSFGPLDALGLDIASATCYTIPMDAAPLGILVVNLLPLALGCELKVSDWRSLNNPVLHSIPSRIMVERMKYDSRRPHDQGAHKTVTGTRRASMDH